MRSSTWLRATCLCGSLLLVCGLLSWRVPAADVEPDSDVDLTLGDAGGDFTNSVRMKFRGDKAGKFMMGATDDEPQGNSEKPRHQVTLTKDFYVGVYEVTQKQYKKVMGTNPSFFCKDGQGANQVQGIDTDHFPVDNVTWNEDQEFI